ncbi:putative RNA-directed DNA polymerase from transposon BS [Caerostris extrusa]|uniref:RNA-directed DNA polymerase from transposon BS n=1 Tax=Caerostris extrusa TaxID=172846 RepID=A0AAV4TRB6_CAEEX|nr:putative RNA-directed DNA polymerase from transposon BS [Caerostris extrusa]
MLHGRKELVLKNENVSRCNFSTERWSLFTENPGGPLGSDQKTNQILQGSASNELFNDPITSSKLLYAIQQLDFKKSPGPDGIHGQFILNLGSCATKRLLHIFNLSWKLGRLPRQWKTVIIVPIRKTNKDAICMGSYLPIALTCMTCKLMERIILRRITFHLMNRSMLPQEQYGFLARDIVQSTKYSTLSNGLGMHTI